MNAPAEARLMARERLREAFAVLSDEQLLAALFVLQGYSCAETAHYLGTTRQAVSANIRRAVGRIADALPVVD